MEQASFYQFNTKQLCPGDIILTTDLHSLVSKAIKISTHSSFSHAIIVTNPPLGVEALGSGVVRINLRGLLVSNRNSVRVLRLSGDQYQLTGRMAAEYSENQVLAPYALKDAISSILPVIPPKEVNAFFCSNLVAEAYEHAGKKITDKAPKKTTPEDLLNSTVLTDVTHECIVEATPIAIATAGGILDDDRPKSPHHHEVEKKREVLNRVKPLLSECNIDVRDYEDILKCLFKSATSKQLWVDKIDSAMAAAIIEVDLFSVLAPATRFNEAYSWELRVQRALIDSGQVAKEHLEAWVEELDEIIRTKQETVEHLKVQWQGARKIYLQHGLETFYYEALLNDLALRNALQERDSLKRLREFLLSTINENF
jgi:hypothetical protein